MRELEPAPVLFVIHKFDRRAGPDQLVSGLLQRLDRARWTPSVFMLDFELFEGPSLLEETMPADVPLRTAPWRKGKGLPEAIRAFQAMRREVGAQIIHSHDMPSHLVSVPLRRRHGPVRIASLHGIVDQTRRQRQWNTLGRWLMGRMDHVFVSSDYVRSAVPNVPDARCSMLLNAIEVGAFRPAAPERLTRGFTPDDPLRLICVARISEEKGHVFLIEAMQRLEALPVHLDIVGTGPLLEKIRARAAAASNVTVHGFVDDPSGMVRAADVFALASIRESLSLGVLEAMAQGLPVLTTDVGAHPGVVGGSGAGQVVPRADAGALAQAIRSWLETPALLPQMARRGLEKVHACHSMEYFTGATQKAYADCLATRPQLLSRISPRT